MSSAPRPAVPRLPLVFVAVLTVVAAAAAAPPALAQGAASITGVVTDESGGALAGALVRVQAATGRLVASTATDGTGRYQLTVPDVEGRQTLWFSLVGFATARLVVEPRAGQTTVADAVLHLQISADVTVIGRRTFRNLAEIDAPELGLLGVADAASEGLVTGRQIEARPIMRAGEILETIPGLVISQHSGEGKANQYYLRGFNLDHGTDFFTTVAGVPVNLPTHAHGHGYADANFLIPELVSGVQFRKGPYFADEGDFSAAGAAHVRYLNVLERPLVSVSGGQDGWGRVLAAASPDAGDGHLLTAIEVNRNDGPWERHDDYRKVNAVARYSRGDARQGFSVTGLAYHGRWDATDQVPRRAIDEGVIGRFGAVSDTEGGTTGRYGVSTEWQRATGTSLTRVTGFGFGYRLNLFSNFTYFLDDPDNGDQFEQEDRRLVGGATLSHRRTNVWAGRQVEHVGGVQVRHDDIGTVGLYRTTARVRRETVREDAVRQTSAALYGSQEVQWTPWLRSALGLRADRYRFDVDAGEPVNGGVDTAALVSPKAALILGPWARTELYVNAGRGFHSNDARGATIAVDPSSGDPVDRVTPLVRATGAEVGLRTTRWSGIQTTVAVWRLDLDSELLFVGDAGTTEAGRPSRRYGIEWSSFVTLVGGLTLDADVSLSRARFRDEDEAGSYIPGAVERVVALGATLSPDRPVFGSVRLRAFGGRPLIEDGSVRSEATRLVNAQAGYRVSARSRVVVDAFNLLNARVSDIDYFYTSRLAGEPFEGVDDVHTHPALPRTVRVALLLTF